MSTRKCVLYVQLVELLAMKFYQEVAKMATNPPSGDGHRNGAVKDRSQVQNPVNGNYTKRDTDTGKFIDQKTDGKPFKGVRKEK